MPEESDFSFQSTGIPQLGGVEIGNTIGNAVAGGIDAQNDSSSSTGDPFKDSTRAAFDNAAANESGTAGDAQFAGPGAAMPQSEGFFGWLGNELEAGANWVGSEVSSGYNAESQALGLSSGSPDTTQSDIETVTVTSTAIKSDAAFYAIYGYSVNGAAAWAGATGYASGAARNAYGNAVANLDPADSAGRTALKNYYRDQTPQPVKAYLEMVRSDTGPRLGSNMSANISNTGWNTAGEAFGTFGKVTLAGTVAYDAIDIATANNKVQAASVDVGSTAGGIAGGWAGAEAGAAIGAGIGVWFGGVGAAPGAFIGGVIGGFVGSAGGGYYGGATGQYLYNKFSG